MRQRTLLPAICLAVLASAAAGQSAPSPARRPTLVVLVTIDQMRSDYYDRFREHLQYGLQRFYENGVVFTEAYHDHAFTETAPGHASLLSGMFPVHTGIMTNREGVNIATEPVLGGGPSDQGASPFRFRATTLVDWLREASPDTRFLSVSRKDRAAILPIGRSKGPVFWFATTGEFTTSTYYADSLPAWVRNFNRRRLAQAHVGDQWSPLYGSSYYAEADSVPVENNGRDFVFPHKMPASPADADTAIIQYPWMDEITLQFALEGVQALGLGTVPGRTDVLTVSLSTTDAIGHRYGPDSKELHDQILRVDRYLGAFMDSLFVLRDSNTVLMALTGDHGMTPNPTVKSHIEPNAGATHVDLSGVFAMTRDRLARMVSAPIRITFSDGILELPTAALASQGVSADSVALAFAADAMRIQGVQRADLLSRLANADTVHDKIARRWLHSLNVSPDTTRLVVTLQPYSYWSSVTYATHGSPHDADAHVPFVIRGAGIRPGRHSEFVRTVDLGPTLAAILGVPTPRGLDGRSVLTMP